MPLMEGWLGLPPFFRRCSERNLYSWTIRLKEPDHSEYERPCHTRSHDAGISNRRKWPLGFALGGALRNPSEMFDRPITMTLPGISSSRQKGLLVKLLFLKLYGLPPL